MKKSLFGFCFLILSFYTHAQLTRHLIQFTDKGQNSYALSRPTEFLSTKAIERRTRFNISLDSTDLPVSPAYLQQVKNLPGVTILNVSKWLNQVSIRVSDPAALQTIQQLNFVKSTRAIASGAAPADASSFLEKSAVNHSSAIEEQTLHTNFSADNVFDYGEKSQAEIALHNGQFLHNIGLQGQNMTISMLDAGFYNYNTLDAMDSIIANGQVLDTWDFVNLEANVANDHPHGMQCLSTIAANLPGRFVGKAPKANFYLYVTEDVRSEYPIEEHNWVVAAERSDSAGADIISSSLGYYYFDDASQSYTYQDMDGRTTMAAKGATMAARKGLLVFNAAGNEGSNSWKYILTPADADSIVAVGSVSSAGIPSNSSSYGPTADGRIKPDVASVGVSAVVQATNNNIGSSSGTSFACPNMAGLAACLWQAFPEYNNISIINTLKAAGDKTNSPDDRTGYGIPDMKKAFSILLADYASVAGTVDNCIARIEWTSKDMNVMKYVVEKKDLHHPEWTAIDSMIGRDIVLKSQSYSIQDNLDQLPAGTIHYRVKQVIDTVSYTEVILDSVTVNLSNSCIPIIPGENKTVHIYPNPVIHGELQVAINTPTAINSLSLQVVDMNGRMIYREIKAKDASRQVYTLPLHFLAAGQYSLVIRNGQETIGTVSFIRVL